MARNSRWVCRREVLTLFSSSGPIVGVCDGHDKSTLCYSYDEPGYKAKTCAAWFTLLLRVDAKSLGVHHPAILILALLSSGFEIS